MAGKNGGKRPGSGPKSRVSTAERQKQLEELCSLQCTYPEIAAFFHVTPETVENWARKPKLRAIMERGKQSGIVSLRRSQIQLALNGNATMNIWLGKNLLGQKDEVTTVHSGAVKITDDSPREHLFGRVLSLLDRQQAIVAQSSGETD